MVVAGSLQVFGCCCVGGGVRIGFKAISVYRHEGDSVWSHDCLYIHVHSVVANREQMCVT